MFPYKNGKRQTLGYRNREHITFSEMDTVIDLNILLLFDFYHVNLCFYGNVGQVFLDPKERNNTEYKLESFSAVYRKLSGKDVVFEYPITEA